MFYLRYTNKIHDAPICSHCKDCRPICSGEREIFTRFDDFDKAQPIFYVEAITKELRISLNGIFALTISIANRNVALLLSQE